MLHVARHESLMSLFFQDLLQRFEAFFATQVHLFLFFPLNLYEGSSTHLSLLLLLLPTGDVMGTGFVGDCSFGSF